MKTLSIVSGTIKTIILAGMGALSLNLQADNSNTLNQLELNRAQLLEQFEHIPSGQVIKLNNRTFIKSDDMLIAAEQPVSINGTVRPLAEFDTTKASWTNGNVYYQFADNVNQEQQQQFLEAAQVWSDIAQITFIARQDEANYIKVESASANFATVGMVGGEQTLSVSDWGQKYVIVHEIGHSLGMWHEHQRSDRDQYVTIHEENIQDNQMHNFNLRSTTSIADYDFLSTMHYSSKAWTKNEQHTILPKEQYTGFTQDMGQRKFISAGDQKTAATQYGVKNLQITDAAFKSYLTTHYDTNGDGELDSLEALEIQQLQTPGEGQITSIDGVSLMRNLTKIDVSNESLTSIPKLPPVLEQLIMTNNQIVEISDTWSFGIRMRYINIAGNPIDIYACESINFIEETLGNGSIDYSPTQSGDALTCNENSPFILLNNRPKLDLRSKGPQTYQIDVPHGVQNLNISTQNFEDRVGGEMNVYIALNRQPTTSDYDYNSTQAGNIESINVATPDAGTWFILLEPTAGSYEYVNLTASFDSTEPPTNGQVINNGESISQISLAKAAKRMFTITVPENSKNLSININGGTGDADLYVKYANEPTESSYDCRPYLNGNNETCLFSNPQAGVYHIMLVAYQDFENVTLSANFETTASNKVEVNNISAAQYNWKDYVIEIPANVSTLTIKISGGTGDADLYARFATQPTLNQFVCRPYLTGNNETCVISNPQAGKWYISLYAFQSFNGVTLEADWD